MSREDQVRMLDAQGVDAFNREDWWNAAIFFWKALDLDFYNPTVRAHYRAAEFWLKRQRAYDAYRRGKVGDAYDSARQALIYSPDDEEMLSFFNKVVLEMWRRRGVQVNDSPDVYHISLEGRLSPVLGYRWINENDQLDMRVESNPNAGGTISHPNTRSAPVVLALWRGSQNNSYNYARVIDQFHLNTSARYSVSGSGDTYCNIFVWDVTRAMSAEIPHWVIVGDASGASAVGKDGRFRGAQNERKELGVNDTIQWLSKFGRYHGWMRISFLEAQSKANGGHPTVAVWGNPHGHGHIAIVRPGSVAESRSSSGLAIAQAGQLVANATHLKTGFNLGVSPKAIEYWSHE